MSDLFYKVVRALGRPIVFGASRTLVLHPDRANLPGGCLLAANHHSYFDSMVLVGTTGRAIDWLSIVELFRHPWQRWFMQGINCLPLDRSQPDARTTRQLLKRLKFGRMIGLFPEAGLRKLQTSILAGGEITPGLARLAEVGNVPVLPVVVLGAGQFVHPRAWLPGAKTFLAINYGTPIHLPETPMKFDAREQFEQQVRSAFATLFDEIRMQPEWKKYATGPWWIENYPTI